MDYIVESVLLGIDAILFYYSTVAQSIVNKQLNLLKNAPMLNKDEIERELKKSGNQTLPLVAIRGLVEPIDKPIESLTKQGVTGVVQHVLVKQHDVQRTHAGFWTPTTVITKSTSHAVPFCLSQKNFKVQIINPLAATILGMETVTDHFEEAKPFLFERLANALAGRQPTGVQTLELMLPTGATVTAVGQLSSKSLSYFSMFHSSKSFCMSQPSNGGPFYLTTQGVPELIRVLEKKIFEYRFGKIALGIIGAGLITLMLLKYWNKRKRAKERQRTSDEMRLLRERAMLLTDTVDNSFLMLCVVCRVNPKQVIIHPCGHVCLCEECSERIDDLCPVCRVRIAWRAPAFIA